MKWFSRYRMRLMFAGMSVAAVVGIGEIAKADFTFGEPTNLGPTINSAYSDALDCFSADGLEMYINSDRSGYWDLWVATRETIDDDWGTPTNLGLTVTASQTDDCCAFISFDGLELYFNSINRPGGHGGWDTWVSTRETKTADWGIPLNLGQPVNSSASDLAPHISADGLVLYFSSRRTGGFGSDDIWVSRRTTKNDPWGEPINLGSIVNSSASENYPFLSADGLLLFFSEEPGAPIRPGGYGNIDMWVTRRASISDPWEIPVNLGPIVNTTSLDCAARTSLDGSILYFCSARTGGFGGYCGDIYQAPILPIVDFNGDGRVNGFEFSKLVDHWGEYAPSCDVGPTPLGDGVVDIEDMVALAEYIGQDIDDPTLVAHWALEETEGNVAYDSAGENDATIIGDVVWLPTDGMVNGALLLDGINSYCATESVYDPTEGPLSVCAWVQGGAPGQVIVSQIAGVNWLLADETSGTLMTGLKEPGRRSKPLVSDAVITDGLWHRVGLVWDGTHRSLYVDDVLVATGTQSGLAGSGGGLHIGCDKNMTVGSFWAGMIDDVRMYSRAVAP